MSRQNPPHNTVVATNNCTCLLTAMLTTFHSSALLVATSEKRAATAVVRDVESDSRRRPKMLSMAAPASERRIPIMSFTRPQGKLNLVLNVVRGGP